MATFYYSTAQTDVELDAAFIAMQVQGLLACAMSALVKPTLADWRRITAPERGTVLLCRDAATHALAGCAMLSWWRGRVWEFDFTVYRSHFSDAVPMAQGAFAWAFGNLPCDTIFGLCPKPNRHAWRLATACGFKVLGVLPAACWYARKNQCVDGVLVMATKEDRNMGFGGGGGGSAPVVQPVPKAETTKDVTAASTEARQSQKDRAAKAAGLKNTILSDALQAQAGVAGTTKTLLGQ